MNHVLLHLGLHLELAMSDDDWVWFENEFAQQIQDGTSKIFKLKRRTRYMAIFIYLFILYSVFK